MKDRDCRQPKPLDRKAWSAGTAASTACAILSLCGCMQTGLDGGASALSTKFVGVGSASAISPSSITLTWQPQAGYTSYSVYSSSQDSPIAQLPTGSTYTVSGLKPNTTYSFSVVGTSSDGNQYGVSRQIQATTWSNFLGPAKAEAVDASSIALTWNSPEGPNYQIYYAEDQKPTIASGVPLKLLTPAYVTSSNTGYTVANLKPSTNYSFMVVAKYADGTDSFANSVDIGGTLTAAYLDVAGLGERPVISTASIIPNSSPPVFSVSRSLATYRTDFWLFDPLNPSGPYTPANRIASLMGNGSTAASAPLGLGAQTVVATVTDVFAGQSSHAVLSDIQVVQALPNNGLRVVTAQTTSAINPLPTITNNLISLGPYPSFNVAGAQPGYVTTIYNPATTPPTPVGQRAGNGEIKTNSSSPLPQGLNTLYAVVSYGGATATVNDIKVRVKNIDTQPILAPAMANGGIGTQGFGRTMTQGDFNCDGRPDMAVGAPHGNGVWVYYGTATGLDTSAAPSPTATGTKPLFIQGSTSLWYNYPSPNGAHGAGIKFGANLAVANFNGDYSDSPTNHKPCSDLAVSISGAYYAGPFVLGAIVVYYGSPAGLQASGTLSTNSFTCTGGGSSSCTPAAYHWGSAGVPLGSAYPINTYYSPGMGHAIAAGDVDGDGYADLVGGAPFTDDVNNNGQQTGIVALWRGTPNGISPLFQKIVLPSSYTRNGATGAFSRFGINVAIGHFVTSARSSGGPADLAIAFRQLASSAPGVSNPAGQSGVVVIPGQATAPYVSVDGAGVAQTIYKILPPQCNTATNAATLPAGWSINANNTYCGWHPRTLAAMDLNNDDYDDILISNPWMTVPGAGQGAVLVYFGSSNTGSFITQGSQSTIPLPSNTCANQPCTPGASIGTGPQIFYRGSNSILNFGNTLDVLGDTNGDGYPDLGIGAIPSIAGLGNVGTAYIYHGSAGGLSATGATQFIPSKPVLSYFGFAMTAGSWSDVNGYWKFLSGAPTFNSVAIGAPGESPSSRVNGVATSPGSTSHHAHGTVSLYNNASPGYSGLVGAPDLTLAPDNVRLTGLKAFASYVAGDVNGDGYAEIVSQVTLPNPFGLDANNSLVGGAQTGFVLYYGSATGPITTRTVNGVATAIPPLYTPLNLGDPLLVTNSSIRSSGSGFNNPSFAYNLTPAGDMDGDGYADIVASAWYDNVIFHGNSTGLIVSPTPRQIPYDTTNRPSRDPMYLMYNYYATSAMHGTNDDYPYSRQHFFRSFGDFNGDGISDMAQMTYWGEVIIVYGSTLGPVTDGNVWDGYFGGPSWAAAPDTNRAGQTPNCSGTPLVCTPLIIYASDKASAPNAQGFAPSINRTNGLTNLVAVTDMDGDGTDELVLVNGEDTSWGSNPGNPLANTPAVYGKAGTVSIYYGSKNVGITQTTYVKLRIHYKNQGRCLGSYLAGYTSVYWGGSSRGYDINGDGLGDLLMGSWLENTGYIVYGVPGPGTSPTATSGAYIQQSLCSSFPCTLDITQVATADYQPNHVTDVTAANPDTCSPALRTCNVMRFPLNSGASYTWWYHQLYFFGTGDITGDGFADAVLSQGVAPTSPYSGWGNLTIFSGSPKGLQVTGTPTAKPSCVNGACSPMLFSIPTSNPKWLPTLTTQMEFFANGGGIGDVDGDGKNDFLIQSPRLNALDPSGNIIAAGTGGFFLFH